MEHKGKLELTWVGKYDDKVIEPRILMEDREKSYGDPRSENMLIHGDNLVALQALQQDFYGSIKCIYIVILTPILMSILSSENAQRFNQSKTYFTLDLLIGWHSTLLRVSRP